jgi:hypothetical protein
MREKMKIMQISQMLKKNRIAGMSVKNYRAGAIAYSFTVLYSATLYC